MFHVDYETETTSGPEVVQTALQPVPPAQPQHLPAPMYYYPPPKRRIPGIFVAVSAFALGLATLFAVEKYTPAAWKPTTHIGDFTSKIIEAEKRGELKAQIGYDLKLKAVETQQAQQVEYYRGQVQNLVNYYNVAYQRANIFAQTAANLQQRMVENRMVIAQQNTGGEAVVGNLATGVGVIAAIFGDADTAQKSFALSDAMTERAVDKVTQAALTSPTMTFGDWNKGLPTPSSNVEDFMDLKPVSSEATEYQVAAEG